MTGGVMHTYVRYLVSGRRKKLLCNDERTVVVSTLLPLRLHVTGNDADADMASVAQGAASMCFRGPKNLFGQLSWYDFSQGRYIAIKSNATSIGSPFVRLIQTQ